MAVAAGGRPIATVDVDGGGQVTPTPLSTPLDMDPNAPWDEIRRWLNGAPYLAARASANVTQLLDAPGRSIRGGSSRLTRAQTEYLDLQRAISEMDRKHPDGVRLRMIVELWIEGHKPPAIGKRLPFRQGKHAVRAALDRAFYWMCHPHGGRLMSFEAWGLTAAGQTGQNRPT